MQIDGLRLIVAHLRDIKRVPAFLRAYGMTDIPSPEQLRKWRQRGVPGNWLIQIMACIELETGRPVSLAGFIEEGSA